MLNEDTFSELTNGGKLDEWKKLAGKYFRCYDTMSDDYDVYYLDDYDGRCSFKTWQRRKCCYDYDYNPKSERMSEIKKMVSIIKPQKNTYIEYLRQENPDMKLEDPTEMDDLRITLEEFGGRELLEKLRLEDVFNISDNFIYEYDYGDGWQVNIELLEEYKKDIVVSETTGLKYEVVISNERSKEESGIIVDLETNKQIKTVMTTSAPICTEVDGLSVFDDVGGIGGFCEFLKGINGEENYHDYDPDSIAWARSLGWTGRMTRPENMF